MQPHGVVAPCCALLPPGLSLAHAPKTSGGVCMSGMRQALLPEPALPGARPG